MNRRRIWRVLLLLGAMLGGGAWDGSVALAMHEVDHRLTIYGTVRDAQGKPVADARVIISATRLGEGATAFTDRQGYYESTLHVHDTDLGEPIEVSTGDDTKRISAEFNPQDKSTERRMEVSFGAAAAPAAQPGGQSVNQFWWGGGAVLAVLAGVSVALYARSRAGRAKGGRSLKKRRA
ncbi:MAG: carboxypeptidase regulatory-like domain-containing protein [Nitrospirae bacterium]|nr:carboxypeptidase regulatory-like domain-containing protein [Nitrospirota bacterium]